MQTLQHAIIGCLRLPINLYSTLQLSSSSELFIFIRLPTKQYIGSQPIVSFDSGTSHYLFIFIQFVFFSFSRIGLIIIVVGVVDLCVLSVGQMPIFDLCLLARACALCIHRLISNLSYVSICNAKNSNQIKTIWKAFVYFVFEMKSNVVLKNQFNS